jgi:hypothetical protein
MTAPSGSISLAQRNIELSLADSAAFRTWCGAADQAAALTHIHLEGLPQPADGKKTYALSELRAYRPYAIVTTETKQGYRIERDSFGDHADYKASGRLNVELRQDCPEPLGDEPSSEANLIFRNFCGALIEDLAALSGKAGYLCFDRLTAEGPYWPHKQLIPTEGLWQVYLLAIDWSGI